MADNVVATCGSFALRASVWLILGSVGCGARQAKHREPGSVGAIPANAAGYGSARSTAACTAAVARIGVVERNAERVTAPSPIELFRVVLVRRCTLDHWSDAAVTCLLQAKGDEVERCGELLSTAQIRAMERAIESEFEPAMARQATSR